MPTYKTELLRNQEIAAGTMAFHFRKPDGFAFTAGQSLSITLIDPPESNDHGMIRVFTIASAPYEPELMIATRMRDRAFKRVLRTLTSGDPIQVDGPYGEFTLHDDDSVPAVFLTGGIGVTPALSMIRQAVHDKSTCPIFLFLSNRTPAVAPFLDELTTLAAEHANVTFVPTMTKTGSVATDWDGETGYITGELLRKYLDDLSAPIYYVVGPTTMALAMQRLLRQTGVGADRIRFEDFSGY